MLVPRRGPLLGANRTWAVLALAGCVTVVVTLGLLFRGQASPDGFDRAADAPVVTFFAGRHGLLPWLALPGTVMPAVAVSAVIAACCLAARRLTGAVLAVTAVPVAAARAGGGRPGARGRAAGARGYAVIGTLASVV